MDAELERFVNRIESRVGAVSPIVRPPAASGLHALRGHLSATERLPPPEKGRWASAPTSLYHENCGLGRVRAMALGGLFGSEGDYPTARACFALSTECSLRSARESNVGIATKNPDEVAQDLRHGNGPRLATELGQGFVALRMHRRAMGVGRDAAYLPVALDWYARVAPQYVDWFLVDVKGRPPPSSGTDVVRVVLYLGLTARGLGAQNHIEATRGLVARLEEGFRKRRVRKRPGAVGPSYLGQAVGLLEMARAVGDGDRDGFVAGFQAYARELPPRSTDPWPELFDPHFVFMYLQGCETFGPIEAASIGCLPRALSADAYWSG